MVGRRILLMHVTTSSGHHHASRAIVQALGRLDPFCQVVKVDAFDYTSRFVRWGIQRTYLSLIKHQPNVWEYLYDNPAVGQHLQRIRALLHRYHVHKLQRLLETVQPHAVACTQAFPCGMIADFKRQRGLELPIVGVLTDFAPHLYWLHENVDTYVVPSEDVGQRFIEQGIAPERIQVLGIPVEPRFLDAVDRESVYAQHDLDPALPVVLVMGGGGGFGPIPELVRSLDRVAAPCQIVVLAGTNQQLLGWCRRQAFRQRVSALGYVDTIPQLMDIATMVITKPGGLTTSEALAKRLPLLIITSIPGQEQCNARYLLARGAAVQLGEPQEAAMVVSRLLERPGELEVLRANAARLSHPESALETARLLLELADRRVELDQETVWEGNRLALRR